jgi:hypothetical protein
MGNLLIGYHNEEDRGDTSATASQRAYTSGQNAMNPPGVVTFAQTMNLKRGWWAFDINITAGPNHEAPMHGLCAHMQVWPDSDATLKFIAEVQPPNPTPVVECAQPGG